MRTYTRRLRDYQVIEGAHELCRLCLEKSDENISIFDENSDDFYATLSLRIMICVGLEISRDDSLPNKICTECYRELTRCYTFRKKCEKSYQKLKLHIEAIKQTTLMLKDEKHINNDNLVLNDEPNESNIDEAKVFDALENDQYKLTETVTNVNDEDMNNSNAVLSTEEDNLDISTFLSSILYQVGVISKHDGTLSVLDPSVNTIKLIMGGDNSVSLELMEEDEEENRNLTSTPVNDMKKTDYNSKENCETEQTVSDNLKHVPNDSEGSMNSVAEGAGVADAWCDVCCKWLASAGALRCHTRVHTGEKPYVCKECGRSFAQTASLNRHRLVHLDIRPFQCEICAKSFTQRSTLQKHKAQHTPAHSRPLMLYRCSICPKVFLYQSSLSRHMCKHKGFKFICGTCDKTFTEKTSLFRHIRNSHGSVEQVNGIIP